MFVDPYQLRHALRDGISITAAGAVQLSAGTTSSARSDFTFSNSPSVTFGLNGVGVITASVNPAAGGLTNIKVSAGTLSQLRSDITFNNSPSVTFGLAAGVVTASVATNYQSQGAYLTTAALSQDSSKYAGTGFTTATTAGTNIVGTLSNNGLSMGVPAYLTAASAGITAINVSAGTTSSNVSAVTFSNGNGVSFGFDGSNITAAIVSQSSIFLSGNTSLTSSGTLNGTSLILRADGLVSLAVSSNSVVISGPASTIFQYLSNTSNITSNAINTNQSSGFAGIGFTTASTTGSDIVGTLATNGLSMGVPAYLTNATAAFPRLDQVLDASSTRFFQQASANVGFRFNNVSTNATWDGAFMIEAGAGVTGDVLHVHHTNNDMNLRHLVHVEGDGRSETGVHVVVTKNSGNVLPIWVEGGTVGMSIDLTSAGQPFVLNSNNTGMVSFLNADAVDGREGSALAGTGFTTATTAGANVVGTLGTGGLSMGIPAYLTTAVTATSPPQATLSHWQNFPYLTNIQAFSFNSNTSYVFPISVANHLSAGYMRFLGNWGMTSTFFGTTGVNNVTGTTTAFNETIQYDAVFYSLGNNANSHSLQYVTSTSGGLTWSVSVSQQSTSNASQQTIGQTLSFNVGGVYTSVNTVYSQSSNTGNVFTSQWTDFTGQKFLDVPFNGSLSPGNYWVGLGVLTGTSGSKSLRWSGSFFGVQQVTTVWANVGQTANAWDMGMMIGLGSYTNAATGTTSSINMEALSSSTGIVIPIMKIVRQS